MMEEQFMDKAFQRCAERGWLKALIPSTITEQEIGDFEQRHQISLPLLYKAFLRSYQLPEEMYDICGIVFKYEELSPLWLSLYGVLAMSKLDDAIKDFREDVVDFRKATADSCRMLVPIGDWGAGWGPLCIDLTKDEQLTDENDESTWSLVWFDHEEFDWRKDHLGADGLLHGTPAAPNLKTLFEWYLSGSLEPEFEEENQVKVSYERLNDREFCNSYWDDKWKE